MSPARVAWGIGAAWLVLVVLLAAFDARAAASPQIRKVVGKAYHLKTGKLAYTLTATETWVNGKITRARMDAYDPSGKHIFKRRADYSHGSTTPHYWADNLLTGGHESVRRKGNRSVVAFRQTGEEALRTEVLPVPGPVVHPEGVGAFVQQHWDRLLHGKKVSFSMVAPTRLDHYRFRAVGLGVQEHAGRQVLRARLEPESGMLRMFAGELVLTYDLATRALLEYRGLSNVTNAAGEALTVRLVLSSDPEALPSVAPTAP